MQRWAWPPSERQDVAKASAMPGACRWRLEKRAWAPMEPRSGII
ncbi:hypothetical protein [Pectobacterium sp. CHL-2024]